jgi:cysteine-rich repeat protein
LNNAGTVLNSFWDIQTSGRSASAGGTGKTTAQMMQQATYSEWDFTNTWTITEEVTYPQLQWQLAAAPPEPNLIQNSTGGTVEDQGITVTIPQGSLGTTELLVTIVPSVHSFAPVVGITNISQPLDIGPQCTDIEDESTCGETNGCRWNGELPMCESIPFSSPVTITMPGDCTGAYGDLITQKIAKYNVISGTPESVSTCDYNDTGGGIYSCQEMDGRTMAWDTNTCMISVQVWSFSTYAVIIQEPQCPDGMVAYWTFDDQTAKDNYGSNNGDSPVGLTWWGAGLSKVGTGSVYFNGDQAITIPDADALSPANTGEFSYEFWMKTTSNSDAMTMAKGGFNNGNFEWAFSPYNSGAAFRPAFWTIGGGDAVSDQFLVTNTNIQDGNWHHVVITFKQDVAAKAYVDRVLKAISTSFPGTMSNGASPLYIGAGPIWQQYYTGALDEVAIYNKVLTDGGCAIGQACGGEIADHYNSGNGKNYCAAAPPAPVCGNGAVEAGEQCDDNNIIAGDGCDATCQIEVVSCGAQKYQSFTLYNDLNDCTNNGLYLGSDNIVLDCNGHSIKGTGYYGIYSYKNNVTIKNCNIEGFNYGMWVGYKGTLTNNKIINCTVKNSGRYGLYMKSSNSVLSGNSFCNSTQTDIYSYVTTGNTGTGNTCNTVYQWNDDGVTGCTNSCPVPHICTPGETQSCYTGSSETEGVGQCQAGTQECSSDGTAWGECVGEVTPQVEECNDADDDCNGIVDDVAQFNVPDCSKNEGECSGAKQVCSGGEWADCTESDYQANSPYYSILENTKDLCWDTYDNDCNGAADALEPNCQPGGIPLEPCTLNEMMDINNDGTIDSYDAILMLRQIIMYPNQFVETKNCQAISVAAQ